MADIRLSTLPRRTDSANTTVLSYLADGTPVGLDPVALVPTPAAIGAASQDDLTEGLATKQDAAARGLANGYAPLDAGGLVPVSHLPASGGGASVELSNADPLAVGVTSPGTATTASRADHVHPLPTAADIGAAPLSHSHSIGSVNGLQAALDGKQSTSGRGAINGYAPLGSDGKVPVANLPPGISADQLDAKANTTDVNDALALKANITYVDSGLAGKANSNDSRIVNAVQPDHLSPPENFSANDSATQAQANKIRRCTAETGVTVTLPALSIGTVIRYIQSGAGVITFAAGTSQVIQSLNASVTSAGQHSDVIATVVAANTWHLSGVSQ